MIKIFIGKHKRDGYTVVGPCMFCDKPVYTSGGAKDARENVVPFPKKNKPCHKRCLESFINGFMEFVDEQRLELDLN